ncbi:MAG: HAMP domain-containing histidine kinase [Clostridia bacterium]|nr:HAMP domain-containing histidine kinase [Clostridia bacterium]
MRIFADRHNRRLFLSVSAVLLIYTILIQLFLRKFSLPVLIISVVSSFSVLIICVLFFKKQDSIIENAARNVKSFLSGNKDKRIECNEEGELFHLFQTVNTLSTVLNAQTEREIQTNEFLKSTISDISHQLKTPLSAISIYNELIADNPDDAKQLAQAAQKEIDRMEKLVKNLLKLTRLDAGAIVFEKHNENIADIMGEVKSRFSCRAELEKKEIRLSGGDELLFCDASWLTEAFCNIIKNALDHTAENSIVSVNWKKSGNILNVTFSDNGSGIHPEDIGYVFKRFYRSRFSKETQGAGLGLPIAKTIIEAHEGMVEVESELGKGTTFSISFLIPTEL